MYEQFFGLEHAPFQISPDPDFLFPSRVHEEALQQVRYALNHFKGSCLVVGPVGSGKTTICRQILRELDSDFVDYALILNPRLQERELLVQILTDPVPQHWQPIGSNCCARLYTVRPWLVQIRRLW